METKTFELKRLDEDGSGLAKIATLSAIDHDGDTYETGAFGEQPVKVLAGHSWDGVPIGKGRVFEKGDEVFAEFKLNLDTEAGKEWHASLKFDLDKKNGSPLQEWSYGFRVLESVDETRDGNSVRVLKSLEVFEVSPVVKGAGVGTGTVAIKGKQTFDQEIAALTALTASVTKRANEVLDWRKGKAFSETRLAELAEEHTQLGALIDQIEAKLQVDAVVKRLNKGKGATDHEVVSRLLATFTAIRHGKNRRMTDG